MCSLTRALDQSRSFNLAILNRYEFEKVSKLVNAVSAKTSKTIILITVLQTFNAVKPRLKHSRFLARASITSMVSLLTEIFCFQPITSLTLLFFVNYCFFTFSAVV